MKSKTVSRDFTLVGVEWNGPAYDPTTGLLDVPAVDWCFKFTLAADDSVRYVPGEFYLGGKAEPSGEQRGVYGGVATYAANGRQFVATISGGGSLTFGGGGAATLFVFGLPGDH